MEIESVELGHGDTGGENRQDVTVHNRSKVVGRYVIVTGVIAVSKISV